MRKKTLAVLGTAACLILVCVAFAFSQDAPSVISDMEIDSDMQWLWGVAASIDTQKNELLVQYIDYDTEQDKEMMITVDEQTTYENVESLTQIELQDTVSIDYAVSPDGKNVAKNISVEKTELSQEEGTEELPPEILNQDDLERTDTQETTVE